MIFLMLDLISKAKSMPHNFQTRFSIDQDAPPPPLSPFEKIMSNALYISRTSSLEEEMIKRTSLNHQRKRIVFKPRDGDGQRMILRVIKSDSNAPAADIEPKGGTLRKRSNVEVLENEPPSVITLVENKMNKIRLKRMV